MKLSPLYLIAEDGNTARAWHEGLRRIHEKVSGMSSAQRHTWWLWDRFKAADKDGNAELEAKEVKKFFNSINLEMTEEKFNHMFAKYDTDRKGLNFFYTVQIINIFCCEFVHNFYNLYKGQILFLG